MLGARHTLPESSPLAPISLQLTFRDDWAVATGTPAGRASGCLAQAVDTPQHRWGAGRRGVGGDAEFVPPSPRPRRPLTTFLVPYKEVHPCKSRKWSKGDVAS